MSGVIVEGLSLKVGKFFYQGVGYRDRAQRDLKAALGCHHFYEFGGETDGRKFQRTGQHRAKTTVAGITE